MFEQLLEEHRTEYRSLEFSSTASLRGCLQRGVGISFCPLISVENELRSGTLQILPWPRSETSVVMVRHIDKWCSPLLHRFIEIVSDRFR